MNMNKFSLLKVDVIEPEHSKSLYGITTLSGDHEENNDIYILSDNNVTTEPEIGSRGSANSVSYE